VPMQDIPQSREATQNVLQHIKSFLTLTLRVGWKPRLPCSQNQRCLQRVTTRVNQRFGGPELIRSVLLVALRTVRSSSPCTVRWQLDKRK